MTRIRTYADESGATAIEYALIVAAIAALIVLIVVILGQQVARNFCDTSSAMEQIKGIDNPNCP